MSGAQRLRVVLLVWKPQVPDDPMDVTQGWPDVLQVQLARDHTVWEPPGVVVRPGEQLVEAAARVAGALGLTSPKARRVLAVDEYPADGYAPAEAILLLDGGWCTDADVIDVPECLCAHERDCAHRRRWATAEQACEADAALTAGLGAAVGATPAFVIERKEGCRGRGEG